MGQLSYIAVYSCFHIHLCVRVYGCACVHLSERIYESDCKWIVPCNSLMHSLLEVASWIWRMNPGPPYQPYTFHPITVICPSNKRRPGLLYQPLIHLIQSVIPSLLEQDMTEPRVPTRIACAIHHAAITRKYQPHSMSLNDNKNPLYPAWPYII